jgi:hypothetical protein
MACSDKFYMAGSEGTGQYIVVAVTPAGKVGYRDLGGGWCGGDESVRIRMEPASLAVAKRAAEILTLKLGWKQALRYFSHFSFVVRKEEMRVPMCLALAVIGARVPDDVEVNPDAPDWAKAMMACPSVGIVGDRRTSVSAGALEALADEVGTILTALTSVVGTLGNMAQGVETEE